MHRRWTTIFAATGSEAAATAKSGARGPVAAVRTLIAAALALVTAAALSAPAAAQGGSGGRSYLTPFPKNDVYDLHVFGDYYADDLASALAKNLNSEKRIRVRKDHRTISSIVGSSFAATVKRYSESLANDPVPIAVVMIGGDDRSSIRFPDREKLSRRSDEWKSEYGRRVDFLIKELKRRGAAVYWVGLPILRRQRNDDLAKMLTGIIRERAYLNGIRFIDSYAGFVDENGEYDDTGPDLSGKIRTLRDGDGETFTWAGNLKLAHFVEQKIRRDLQNAKVERSVPLAGSETEQRRINPQRQIAAVRIRQGWTSKVRSSAKRRRDLRLRAKTAGGSKRAGRKAQNSRIKLRMVDSRGKTRTVAVEILRPAISASVLEFVTRKLSPDRAARMGDDVPGILHGGLTVLSSITPTGDDRRSALPPTHAPHYRALIKGEKLQPEPGRADDFRWPRAGTKGPSG